MTLRLGLSRKQAKDLLRFRAVTVKRIVTFRQISGSSWATSYRVGQVGPG